MQKLVRITNPFHRIRELGLDKKNLVLDIGTILVVDHKTQIFIVSFLSYYVIVSPVTAQHVRDVNFEIKVTCISAHLLMYSTRNFFQMRV